MFFLSLMIIGGIVSSATAEKTVSITEPTLLQLSFSDVIKDRSSDSPFDNIDFVTFESKKSLGLNDILKNIEKAANDENISGILFDANQMPGGAATLEEIRNALLEFKKSGKFIISYADVYAQNAYYLASVSDKIYLNPVGQIAWLGLSSEVTFFKGALEKLELEPVIIRHGKFKSAIEPFINEKMSPENREQVNTYVSAIWNQWTKGISESRGVSVDDLNKYANEMTISNATKALEYKLVDSLIYKDQLLSEIKKRMNIEESKDIPSVSMSKYKNVPAKKVEGEKVAKDRIAVIYAEGDIVTGDGDENSIGSDKLSKAIREARRDDKIKAIVLRINSPGGSALASEIIWREVKLAADAKIVVASMGNLAASGGYYIACAADTIIASPTTITGSIGVFGLLLNAEKFMKNKLGITTDRVNTNEHADLGSPTRGMKDNERAVIQTGVEEIYDSFISHVAEGRKMEKSSVDSIGQGRVWAGSNAINIGLVDSYGGLKAAIEVAKKMAGLESYRLVEMPKQSNPVEQLMKSMTEDVRMNILYGEMGEQAKYYKILKSYINYEGIRAQMPYSLEIK